jgi:hypothetical protein
VYHAAIAENVKSESFAESYHHRGNLKPAAVRSFFHAAECLTFLFLMPGRKPGLYFFPKFVKKLIC